MVMLNLNSRPVMEASSCSTCNRQEVKGYMYVWANSQTFRFSLCSTQLAFCAGLTEFTSDLSGFQGLVHAVKLGEDCPTGSIPFSWPHQPVLVGRDRPPQNLLEQWVICEEEPEETWTHPYFSCKLIHIGNKIHLQGCQR